MKPISNIQQHRMTMVELLVAMSVLVIIMGFLGNVIWDVRTLTERKQVQSDVYEQQRLFFDILTQDLRAIYTSDVVYCQFDNYSATPADLGYRARFVSSSGIGTKIDYTNASSPLSKSLSDRSPLVEVGYYYDRTSQTIERCITTTRDGASWDFFPDAGQLVVVDDPLVTAGDEWFEGDGSRPNPSAVAFSVTEFSLIAFDVGGGAFPPAEYNSATKYRKSVPFPPAYIQVRVTLGSPGLRNGDPGFQATMQTFTKKIYINREY